MASIETSPQDGQKQRQRKKSTRIDMTAMVDVAFLLLTFFILTTTLAQPKVLDLALPIPNSDVEVAESKVLTLVPVADGKIHCITGSKDPKVETVSSSPAGVRAVINRHLHKHPNPCPEKAKPEDIAALGCWDPIIVIKPGPGSTYAHVVDLLDEMLISEAKKYALAPFEEADSLLLLALLPSL